MHERQPITTGRKLPGPQLVPPLHTEVRPSRSPLALWHLLSLDAPTVASLWTFFIARIARVALPWTAPAAMFVAVWMIYAADRLLDARQMETNPDHTGLEERHRFHHRYRSRFLATIAAASVALSLLLLRIPHRTLALYSLLATLLGTWLLLIHARSQHTGSHRLPKEFAVGIFFPAAVFIPTVARAPQLQTQLLPAAALLAGACTLNCLFLYAWEHPHEQPEAHWTTLWSIQHLRQISLLVLILSAFVAGLHRLASIPALCCALSIAMLLLLHMQRRRIAPIHLRAAADLVLLTPLLFLFR